MEIRKNNHSLWRVTQDLSNDIKIITLWCVSCVKKKKLPEDKAIIIKTMEATTPELGPVGFWSPKSSFFSGSVAIVVEEVARNGSQETSKSTAEYKQVGRSEFLYSA